MSDPATIDLSRPSAILAFTALTREELSTLTAMLRRAEMDSRTEGIMQTDPENLIRYAGMCTDLLILRVEIRAVLLGKLASEA